MGPLPEQESLFKAYERLLSEVRTDTPMICTLLRHLHGVSFGERYEWARRWRTVTISKADVTRPPPNHLDRTMSAYERGCLDKHTARSLHEDDAFRLGIGEIQGEFLAIHPFREGNAGTIKLLTDLLAVQTGRLFLVYDESDTERDRYIDAARSAFFRKDLGPMAEVIRRALQEGRK